MRRHIGRRSLVKSTVTYPETSGKIAGENIARKNARKLQLRGISFTHSFQITDLYNSTHDNSNHKKNKNSSCKFLVFTLFSLQLKPLPGTQTGAFLIQRTRLLSARSLEQATPVQIQCPSLYINQALLLNSFFKILRQNPSGN